MMLYRVNKMYMAEEVVAVKNEETYVVINGAFSTTDRKSFHENELEDLNIGLSKEEAVCLLKDSLRNKRIQLIDQLSSVESDLFKTKEMEHNIVISKKRSYV